MSEYRLAAGTLTAKELEADDNYLVSNFPLQSDMPASFIWGIAEAGAVRRYTRRVTSLSGVDGGFGYTNTTIQFSMLTPGMIAYLDTTFFSTSLTADVTIKLRRRYINPLATAEEDYTVYNAKMHRIDDDELYGLLRNGVAYFDVPYRLTHMTEATAGYGFSIGFSTGFNA